MTTTFDKREEGFEKKFAHDEELRFKANARRNKLLGLWAAEKLGLTGAAADAYAKEVVMADFEEAGDDDVFRKVRKDFDAKGVAQSDQDIRRTMDELMAQAIEQIKAGIAPPHRGNGLRRCQPCPVLARRAAARRRDRLYRLVRAGLRRSWPRRIAREGFAAVTLDQQHGLWDTAAIVAGIAAIRTAARRRSCACRSATSRSSSRALDFGAEGIIAPMINTAADARAFAAAAKFPPLGERSWGPHARHDARRHRRPRSDYLREANDGTSRSR